MRHVAHLTRVGTYIDSSFPDKRCGKAPADANKQEREDVVERGWCGLVDHVTSVWGRHGNGYLNE